MGLDCRLEILLPVVMNAKNVTIINEPNIEQDEMLKKVKKHQMEDFKRVGTYKNYSYH